MNEQELREEVEELGLILFNEHVPHLTRDAVDFQTGVEKLQMDYGIHSVVDSDGTVEFVDESDEPIHTQAELERIMFPPTA